VFEMRPSGKFFVLHTFGNKVPHDPGMPYAGLTLDSAGDVYGTGTSGGNCCFGAVFKLDHRTGAETVVYAFGEPPDGASPEGAPVKDAEGNLYGTTSSGGPVGEYGYGIVYKIDPAGAETILWTFTNGADGANPGGTLVRDRQGNLYGTTYKGGIGEGVVFKLDPNGEETILHNFGSSSPDGSVAVSGLTADADGNLYGTTMFGGAWGWGCVYKVNRNGEFKVIYSFTDGNDGGFPFASPVMDSAGNLYGTTTIGGDPNCYCGTVYKLSLQ
jgi:uncharacterized repeat protein (TIGR03803 family)